MRRVLFIIAFVILANPLLSNIDILPDFVAYILIMIALSKSSYISEKANSAYKCARNMLIASIVKLVSMYFTVVTLDDNLSLVFSFVFFIVELSLGIPFILKLFDYFYSLADKAENTSILKYVERTKILTIVIFASRLLLATLPDFILLTRTYEFINDGPDYSGFRYLLMALAFVLFIPLCILWIASECELCIRLFKRSVESDIVSEFNEKIENKALHYEIKANQRMLIFVSMSLVFAFFLKKDGINIFYNSVIPIFFICYYFALVIKKQIKISKLIYVLIGVTAVQLPLRIVEHIILNRYFNVEKFNINSVFFVSEAETLYYSAIPFINVSSVLFVGAICLMIYLLIKASHDSLKRNLPLIFNIEDYQFNYGDFKKRVIPSAIVTSVLAFLSATLYPTVISYMPYIDELVKIGNLNLPLYSWALPLYTVLTVLFVASFIVTLVMINENSYKRVYNKISLD